jgi:hypothetical protein
MKIFCNVPQFKYLETTVTNKNLIQEEIKWRLNSGNAYYHSVQNILSSRLLSKHVKIIYKTLIFPVVLYGCETYFVALREEHRLRVSDNRVLRRDEVTGGWGGLHDEELCNLHCSPSIISVASQVTDGSPGSKKPVGGCFVLI